MAGTPPWHGAAPARSAVPRITRRVVAWTGLLAGLLGIYAAPVRAAGGDCRFTGHAVVIRLPDILPDQGVDTQVTDATFQVGDCVPAAQMLVRMDDGEHAAGGRRRMKHATREAYLPYTLSLGPPGAQSTAQPDPVRGPGRDRYISQRLRLTIAGAALADLPAGDYSDRVTLTVIP